MGCSQYILNAPQPFVYYGTANRPASGTRFPGCMGIDLTNNILETFDGTTWYTVVQPFYGPPLTYTPTLYTNSVLANLGAGAIALGYYTRQADMVKVWGNITIGTAPTISGGTPLEITLPVASRDEASITQKCVGSALFDGTADTKLTAYIADAQLQRVRFVTATAIASSTVPETITAGDVISWMVDYPV